MTNQRIKIPKISFWLLKRILPGHDFIYLNGNFQELYETIFREKGRFYAVLWIWGEILKSMPGLFSSICYWRFSMFNNYLKIALRNMKKNKFYSFINVFGLSVGLACSMIIILFVINELTYDSYHNDSDRIYRIISFRKSVRGEYWNPSTPGPLATALNNDLPQVEQAVRFVSPYENANNVLVVNGDERYFEKRIFFTDPEVFEVFNIPVIKGNASEAFARVGTVVISQSMADKYFANEDPIGKILQMEFDYDLGPDAVRLQDFEIIGVVKDAPANSHLKYNMLVSMETFRANRPSFEEDWTNPHQKFCFVKLYENKDVKHFENQIQTYAQRVVEMVKVRWNLDIGEVTYHVQPITQIHMHTLPMRELEPGGNWVYIYIYSLIAGLVLLIGCMNFINLSTAISTTRAKEVGLRKVVGAKQVVIMLRFLTESKMITLISFIAALVVTVFLLPYFNRMAGTDFSLSNLLHPLVLVSLIGLFFLVSISSGLFPALVLTQLKPTSILQRKFTSGLGRSLLQKTLVVGQFAISIFLVICTLFIFKQLNYMKGGALGFDKEQKLILRVKSNLGHLRRDYEAIKDAFRQNPEITGAAVSSLVPGDESSGGYSIWKEGASRDTGKFFRVITMGSDFIPLYDIQMVSGRTFQKDILTDKTSAYIINETAAWELGYTSPDEVIGKRYTGHYHGLTKKIIGVIKDFHYEGMHRKIEPLLLDIETSLMNTITLEVNVNQLRSTMTFVREIWDEHFPGIPIEYSFLDDAFDRVYRYEEQMSELLKIITSLGIIIACLGLSGLASFLAWKRQKEIGIRKVLGASVSDVVTTLSQQFILMVVLSIFFASPLAWIAMRKWLENFAYKTSMDATIFLIASLAAVVVASISVMIQGFRAARGNPADTLRYE